MLTKRAVGAQLLIIAGEALFGSPAIVPAFLDDIDLFKLVLAYVPAEDAPFALFVPGVAPVHRAPPHIADTISINLRSCSPLVYEGVIWRDSVQRASFVVIHIYA